MRDGGLDMSRSRWMSGATPLSRGDARGKAAALALPGRRNVGLVSVLVGVTGAMALSLGLGVLAAAAQPVEVAVRESINPGLAAPPPDADRSTPAASWRAFFALGAQGRFGAAAHLLDLTEVPRDQQVAVGADVAERLFRVLRQIGARSSDVGADDPAGPRDNGSALNTVVAARFNRSGIEGEVWLRRTQDATTGELAWLLTRQTVSSASFWHRVIVLGETPAVEGQVNPGLGPAPEGVSRANPRASLAGFQHHARKGQFAVAAHYLDLSSVPEEEQPAEGRRLARRLLLVMLHRAWVDPAALSNDEFGAPQQGLPDGVQRVATIDVSGQPVDLLLSSRLDPDHGTVWTFSPETTDRIDALYRASGYGRIGDLLPAALFSLGFAGLQLWQWLAIVLLLTVGWLVSRWAAFLAVRVLRAVASRTEARWDDELVRALDGPLALVLWGFLLAGASPWLGLPAGAQAVASQLWQAISLFGFGWLLFRLVDGTVAYLRQAAGEVNPVGVSFLPIAARVIKVLVFAFVALAILDVIGFNVVAILTGLGLGGLAVAFAAQRTLENLFGAAAIAGDRPFTVGQFVTVGDITGTVEDVGLRSTRIRRLDRTLVTIPNSTVASAQVVNFGARDRFLYNPVIGVVYATTADQLRFIIDEMRKMLIRDERVLPDVRRVRFRGFGASSLEIDTMCWVRAADWSEYTGIAEDLNFKVMEIVLRAGSSFAFPSQTLYLSRDSGLDPAVAGEIGREVQRRREGGELAIPEASEELIARLEGERRKMD